MGNRVGLARTQVLIQNLKRSLTMGGTRFSNVKGVEMNVYSDEVSADGSGGFGDTTGIVVPANSVITGLGVVVTTVFAIDGSSEVGVDFGTSAGAHDLTAADDDALLDSAGTSLAVGKGTSTHTHERTAMGGAANIVFEADVAYSTSARTVYGTITLDDSNNVTSGGVVFWVTYRLVA